MKGAASDATNWKATSNSGRNNSWHSSKVHGSNEGRQAAAAGGAISARSTQLQHAMYGHPPARSTAHPSTSSIAIVDMMPNRGSEPGGE